MEITMEQVKDKTQKYILKNSIKEQALISLIFLGFQMELNDDQIDCFIKGKYTIAQRAFMKSALTDGMTIIEVKRRLGGKGLTIDEMVLRKREYFTEEYEKEMAQNQEQKVQEVLDESVTESEALEALEVKEPWWKTVTKWIKRRRNTSQDLDDNHAGEMFMLMLDPRFSAEQIKALSEAYQKGIPLDEMRKIANPDNDIDKLEELIRFLSILHGLQSTGSEIKVRAKTETEVFEQMEDDIKEVLLDAEEEPKEQEEYEEQYEDQYDEDYDGDYDYVDEEDYEKG